MVNKILGITVVFLFIGLVFSILLTNGNKYELIICGLIAVDSFVLVKRHKRN